ncbi:MAG: hypothetical protein NVSMB12_20260 [Acidimicrobiales bacterium]
MNRTVIARASAAASIAVAGFVHFRIWQHEYRHAPVREMFVANAVVSAVLVIGLLAGIAYRRPQSRVQRGVLAAGLLFCLASLAAFALSRGPGLPTLHGSFKEHGLETTAAYVFGIGSAKVVLVTETVGAILCGWLLVATSGSTLRLIGARR